MSKELIMEIGKIYKVTAYDHNSTNAQLETKEYEDTLEDVLLTVIGEMVYERGVYVYFRSTYYNQLEADSSDVALRLHGIVKSTIMEITEYKDIRLVKIS